MPRKSTTYLIKRQEYSEKAGRLHGRPWVWKHVATVRSAPPRDEDSFLNWLWHIVKEQPGTYLVLRTQAEGDSAGFHPVWMGTIDFDHLSTQRRYPQVKSHPGLPISRQLFSKRVEQRVRFRKHKRR